MELTIEYCGTCNYRPIAAALAMAVERALGLRAALIHSVETGAFEVKADGEVVFSKKNSGRFPLHPEIIELLRAKRAAAVK